MIDDKIDSLLKRVIRFSIVGGLSTVVNYACFFFMYKVLQFHYIFSSSIGYIIGLLVGYGLNKNWTFVKKVLVGKSYLFQYSMAQIMGLIFCQILLYILVETFKIDPLLANIIAIGFATIVSFLLIDLFVFKSMGKGKTNKR
jgi:putative flippase GtrA|tara:strand:- start:4002 stop:4427 length:426 start_codon:yes stop_codon:yes gene_type:complete